MSVRKDEKATAKGVWEGAKEWGREQRSGGGSERSGGRREVVDVSLSSHRGNSPGWCGKQREGQNTRGAASPEGS